VIEISQSEKDLTLTFAQKEFYVEMTLEGYLCQAATVTAPVDNRRFTVHGQDGMLVLTVGAC
jgi:hypothetical protein